MTNVDRRAESLMKEKRIVMGNLGLKYDALAQCGPVGEEDRAQISTDEFVSIQINSLDSSKLRLINDALQRIADGDYGICLHCEESIPSRRLEIIPWAKFCVPCQDHLSLLSEQTNGDCSIASEEYVTAG
jgi:DnaK suppressor protein